MDKSKFCQSCGMPLEKDGNGGGTNLDGSKSRVYCSLCYKDGEFVDNFQSADEMVTFVKGVLKQQGIGPIRQWLYTMMIPKLDRWNKTAK